MEAQIAHAERKHKKAEDMKTSVAKDLAKQEDTVRRYQTDLQDSTKEAQASEGIPNTFASAYSECDFRDESQKLGEERCLFNSGEFGRV